MVIFYKKWKKYNEIQLTKNKMDLIEKLRIIHPPRIFSKILHKFAINSNQSNLRVVS